MPSWLSLPVYVLIGCLIGTRFSNVSLMEVRKGFLAGFVVTIAVMVIAGTIAWLISRVTGVPLNAVMIAYAPGGLETMAAMAVMMHADTAYVGSHHVIRLLFLSVLMPSSWAKMRANGTATPDEHWPSVPTGAIDAKMRMACNLFSSGR